MEVGITTLAAGGSSWCGDRGGYWSGSTGTTLCIVDGLGHGKHAEAAATAALAYVKTHIADPLVGVFAGCDRALRHTRGVAMGVAVVDASEQTLTYIGVGNPRAVVVGGADGAKVRLEPNRGLIGAGYRSLTATTTSIAVGDTLVLYTDGLPQVADQRMSTNVLAGEAQAVANTIASRADGNDDVGVLVAHFDGGTP